MAPSLIMVKMFLIHRYSFETLNMIVKSSSLHIINAKRNIIDSPSGSNSRVTPYSFSTTWNAVSRRSRGRADRAFRQSSKSGRLRWISAENANPSRQEPVKSFT